jgi:hypothetical protein
MPKGSIRILSLIASVCVLASGCATHAAVALGETECPGFTAVGADAEEIRRLEHRGAATNVEGWTIEEARSFFAPEWFSVQPDGTVMRLDAVFATFQDGRSRPGAGSFDLSELDIRVYCNTAIVVGLAEARAPGATQTSTALRFRYLNVWRKHEGRWLYAGQQYTRH